MGRSTMAWFDGAEKHNSKPAESTVRAQCPFCTLFVEMYKPTLKIVSLFTRVGDYYRYGKHSDSEGIECRGSDTTPDFGGTKSRSSS